MCKRSIIRGVVRPNPRGDQSSSLKCYAPPRSYPLLPPSPSNLTHLQTFIPPVLFFAAVHQFHSHSHSSPRCMMNCGSNLVIILFKQLAVCSFCFIHFHLWWSCWWGHYAVPICPRSIPFLSPPPASVLSGPEHPPGTPSQTFPEHPPAYTPFEHPPSPLDTLLPVDKCPFTLYVARVNWPRSMNSVQVGSAVPPPRPIYMTHQIRTALPSISPPSPLSSSGPGSTRQPGGRQPINTRVKHVAYLSRRSGPYGRPSTTCTSSSGGVPLRIAWLRSNELSVIYLDLYAFLRRLQ